MILIAALATWLILVLFFVVLCRGAASADGRGFASTERYLDRLAAARDLAGRIGAIVLLKGPLTAVAAPAAGPPDVLLSSAGVPSLATAGTGDVLSGVIGAFLARGVPAHEAAALAAHVHGRAAAAGRPEGLPSRQ